MDYFHRSGGVKQGVVQWARLPKRISLFLLPLLFLTTGVAHFFVTDALIKIVPPVLPRPRLLVYISGVCEMLGGLGLLLPQFRRVAGWGLVLLLVAVFPANLYMAIDHVQLTNKPVPSWLLWARLPLQPLLIWGILWAIRPNGRRNVA